VNTVDVKNIPRKNLKKTLKNVKRGKNKKRLKTLNKKNVGHNVFNFLPNA